MTFEQLDTHVKKYLVYLKSTNALRNMSDVSYKITYSKKSRSFYVKLFVVTNEKVFKKTVRFSDHPYHFNAQYPQKLHGIILEPSKQYSKKEIKYVEATIRKEIKKLQYCAHVSTIYSFKAEDY